MLNSCFMKNGRFYIFLHIPFGFGTIIYSGIHLFVGKNGEKEGDVSLRSFIGGGGLDSNTYLLCGDGRKEH